MRTAGTTLPASSDTKGELGDEDDDGEHPQAKGDARQNEGGPNLRVLVFLEHFDEGRFLVAIRSDGVLEFLGVSAGRGELSEGGGENGVLGLEELNLGLQGGNGIDGILLLNFRPRLAVWGDDVVQLSDSRLETDLERPLGG